MTLEELQDGARQIHSAMVAHREAAEQSEGGAGTAETHGRGRKFYLLLRDLEIRLGKALERL